MEALRERERKKAGRHGIKELPMLFFFFANDNEDVTRLPCNLK